MLYHFLDWLFPRYRQHVYSQLYESLDVVDLVRERLKGVRVETAYLDDMPKEERRDFLANAKDLHENQTLKTIAEHLQSEQIIFIAKEAKSQEHANFGRATINGIALVQDEVKRLAGIWDNETQLQESYNEHEVI